MPNKVPKNLLTEGDMRILNLSVDDGDDFTGEASVSDEEENVSFFICCDMFIAVVFLLEFTSCIFYYSSKQELAEKVSEDAVSSSCNESKPTRNVYVQARFNGSLEALRDRFMKHLEEVRLQHTEEISRNKKKQWVCLHFLNQLLDISLKISC